MITISSVQTQTLIRIYSKLTLMCVTSGAGPQARTPVRPLLPGIMSSGSGIYSTTHATIIVIVITRTTILIIYLVYNYHKESTIREVLPIVWVVTKIS